MMPTKFPVDQWLENLLLDEHREAYANMTQAQKACVRFAYNYGWLTREKEQKDKYSHEIP